MVHTLRLDNYSPTPRKLVLGTNSSFGTESIKIERGAGWDGLNLTATWHIPGREEPLRVALLDGDAMDVPPEVTKEAKDGVLVLAGLASGVQRASCNVEYLILEQAGVYGGADAEPTPELAAQVLKAALQAKADAEAAAEDAAAAKANADKAQQAAENAAADAAKAGPYAEAARAAQEAAEAARDEAIAAQQAAENAAAAAAASKSAADTLAAVAARAAQAAENSKATANNAAYFAGENATAAQQAAATATAAANDAGQSTSDAAASKAAAETAAKAAKDAQAAAAAAWAEAVKAQGAAETAAKSAQDAQAAAEKARDDAKTAQNGAEAARDAAAKSAEAAAKSEANAKQSADTLAESVENVAANTAAVAELKEKKAEIDDTAVGANAWSSKHIIDMLCPPLEESGNPVVCYPVAGYPLGVKASWEPVQEGSETPYPAGGGKNLFNPAWMSKKEVSYGVTWTITPDGTVTANGTTDSTAYYKSDYFSLPAGTYTISAMPRFRISILNTDAGNTTVTAQSVGKPHTFTVENDIQKATLFFATTGTLDNVSAKPQIEKGTTATAWAPYENIRPIKGRDSVTVERCGENLSTTEGLDGVYWATIYEDLLDVLNKLPVGTYVLDFTFTLEKFLDRYTSDTAGSNAFRINSRFDDGTPCIVTDGETITKAEKLPSVRKITETFVITPQHKGRVATAYVYSCGRDEATDGSPNGSLGEGKISNVTITLGSTAPTTYKPYIGQTNALTMPETVYGGEVDAVSGDGNENTKIITLDGTTNMFRLSSGFWNLPQNSSPDIRDGYDTNCSHFPPGTFGGNKNKGYLFTKPQLLGKYFQDVNAFNAYLAAQYAAGTPVQVCYKLAKPVPFTATGAQPMPALAGLNTVLTDADSATVTGRADPIKRIEDLEAAVASIN